MGFRLGANLARWRGVCLPTLWWHVWTLRYQLWMSLMVSSDHPLPPPYYPPTFSSPPPLSTLFLCFSVLRCLAHFFFLTLHAHTHTHTSQSTSILLHTFFFINLLSVVSMIICHNSFTFSGLFPAHFSLWARHPLQVALSSLNISNPLCSLHFQHCFFSTSSTTSAPKSALFGFQMFPNYSSWFLRSHTSQ